MLVVVNWQVWVIERVKSREYSRGKHCTTRKQILQYKLNTIIWYWRCWILYLDNEFHTLVTTNIGIPFSPNTYYSSKHQKSLVDCPSACTQAHTAVVRAPLECGSATRPWFKFLYTHTRWFRKKVFILWSTPIVGHGNLLSTIHWL